MFRLIRNPDPRKKPPYGSRIDPTHPLAQGLVGCWLFNEGGGKILYDQIGLHDMELVSGAWGISRGGQSFVADHSVPDYVECTDLSSELTSQQTGTLVVIHQPTANVAGSLFSICDSTKSDYWGLALNAGNESTGNAVGVIFIRNGDSWLIIKETTEEIFYVGDLCFWVVSQDGTGIRFYVEGKEKPLQDAYGGTSSDATSWIGDVPDVNRLRFGYMADATPDHPYDGYIIAEFEYNRAISESEIFQLHAEPYSIILVPQYWYMVDFGAIGGIDNLTATDILTGPPSLGSPAIGQEHQLTASNVITANPVLGVPDIGQEHTLSASNIATDNPVLGQPILSEEANVDNLIANDILAGNPVLEPSDIGQIHNLISVEVSAQNPILDTPVLSQKHILSASGILTENPVLGNPDLSEAIYSLEANNILAGIPILGTAILGQIHGLTAEEIVTGQPVLGSPYIPREEEATTTSFSTERISSFETVYILGEFTHEEQITIDIYAISTGNKVIDAELCSEIGDTGIYSYLFEPTDNISEEYLWIMTNSLRNITGKIKVGGFIDDIRSNLNRLLGLNKENMFITDTEYDYNGNLISAKIKLYETKSDAEVDEDEFAVYEVMAEYDADGKMSSYLVTKQ